MANRGRDPRIFGNFSITCLPCNQSENSLGDMRAHLSSECLSADNPQLFCGCCGQTFPTFAHLSNHQYVVGAHKRPATTPQLLTQYTPQKTATTSYTQHIHTPQYLPVANIHMLTSSPNTLPTPLLASPQTPPLPNLSYSQTQLVDDILASQFDPSPPPPTPAQRTNTHSLTTPTQSPTHPSLASPQTIPDSQLTLPSHLPPNTATTSTCNQTHTTHTDNTSLLSRLIQENVNLRQTTQTLANHSWWLATMLHEQLTLGSTHTDTTHRTYMAYTPIWLDNRTTSLTTPLPDLLHALQPIYLRRIHDPLLERPDP